MTRDQLAKYARVIKEMGIVHRVNGSRTVRPSRPAIAAAILEGLVINAEVNRGSKVLPIALLKHRG